LYGPRIGLPPSHITNGGNFILAYGESLRETSLQHRADMLIKDGYEMRRVQKVMEEMLDDQIREKLKGGKK
jgi:malate synthase